MSVPKIQQVGVLVVAAGLAACAPSQTALKAPTSGKSTSPRPHAGGGDVDPQSAARVEELVARHIAARGGLDNIHALKSVRFTGVGRFGSSDPVDFAYGVVQARQGGARTEITLQGLTAVTAYDGREGWSLEPFGGRRDPFRKSADEVKLLARDADIDGPLVDWKAKGHQVDYLGTEDIDGTAAHKLRVTFKDGDTEYHYLDPDALLEIRTVSITHVRGAESISETDLGDYEVVGGVLFPFSMASGRPSEPRSQHLLLDRGEANVEIAPGTFSFPAAGAKIARVVMPGPAPTGGPAPAPSPARGASPTLDGAVISGLGARNIGSAQMSGRVSALAATVIDGTTTLFVGAASGGVWKSLDGGTTFTPVFDKQAVQSIGAIALDPSNPNNVWVGTGESWTRNSVSIGDGIYKSVDGGQSWKNVGLPESERITRIIVHPKDGNVVYACVPGKLWSDSPDRGLYKTIDGGKTWSHILKGANLSTGCSGLAMDPTNANVLFTGMWDFRRKGWTFRSGGDGPNAPSGSALYRSADGGATWTEVKEKGLPAHPWGRVEVAVAPSDPKRVYTVIESVDSALFASNDGGATWERRDKSQMMVWRPFYFARLIVDPLNPDRIFKPNLGLIVSDDGGKSFSPSGGGAHGDWHDLWIDPTNTKHIVGGDDGGLWTSWDGGSRWWKSSNLPISQFYHVSIDDKDPYRVYGGLQDNSSWVGDSAYPGGITNSRWENLYGGDGFWVIVDPTDPESVYAESQGGYIGRIDRRTRATRDIQPKARYKEKLRYNWNAPIFASPTQKATIYLGSQFLFRSKDRGDSWERISPDLSTNDPEKQKQEQSGGVTVDNSSAEMHTTIYSISESPRDPNVLWVGTDDGNLQLSRDAGKTWTNVVANVPALPKQSWVSWVEASRYDAATAYATFDRHTFGDMTPWVYKTTDYGKTWKRIAEQAVRGYAHVIKEDTVKRDLLFLGTEVGLFISTDGGSRWAEFKGSDFPSVAVRDLQIHPRDGDLVIATHGRGIWIIDDLTPLRALSEQTLAAPVAFLPSRPVQQRLSVNGGWPEGDASYSGQNPSPGAVISYYQNTRHVYGRLKLEVLDGSGKVVDTLTPTKRRGINRVTWSMQVKAPRVPRAAQVAFSAAQGPRVVPGTYTLRLTKAGTTIETKIDVGLDRRATFNVQDRKAQFEAAMRAHALFGEMSGLVDRVDAMSAAIGLRQKGLPAGDALAQRLGGVATKLDEAKKKIVATKEGGAITGEERIREHLDRLYGALTQWEGRPAKYLIERLDVLKRELGDVTSEVDLVVKSDIPPLDAELKGRKLEPIPTTVPTATAPSGGRLDERAVAAIECMQSRRVHCSERGVSAPRERD